MPHRLFCHHYMQYLFAASVLFAAFLPLGCATPGTRFEQADLPDGAPDIADILADLQRNDARIAAFQATGTFTLKSPELETIEQFRQSTVSFQRPDELYVIGRRYAKKVFELTCDHPAFLIEFPTERQYIHRPEGASLDQGQLVVSPALLAREMFFPEDWAQVDPRRVQFTAYTAETQRAEFAVYESTRASKPIRRIVAEGGTHWVIIRSEWLDKAGETIAITERSDYREFEGTRYPAEITTRFPRQDAEMIFSLKRITLNEPVTKADFAVDTKATVLRNAGWTALDVNETTIEYTTP